MSKLSFMDTLDWILNDAWAVIILVSILALVVLIIASFSTYSLKELRKINDAFVIILLCEEEMTLPKLVAMDVVSGVFHSKISEHLVIDIHSVPEQEDWVKLAVRQEDDERSESDDFIATATEKDFGTVLLTHLL
ncbi:hypothetical protein IJI94_00115 [Candidatus Saccharibacteria bacterium]|nr:hypothetical protein [Candidatus Saccharibacteria bacterium]